MVFEKAKALKQDILEFRSLREHELSYWSISFKDYGLAFIGKHSISANYWPFQLKRTSITFHNLTDIIFLGLTVLVSFFNVLVGIGISFFLLDRGVQMIRRYKPTLPVYFAKLFNKIL